MPNSRTAASSSFSISASSWAKRASSSTSLLGLFPRTVFSEGIVVIGVMGGFATVVSRTGQVQVAFDLLDAHLTWAARALTSLCLLPPYGMKLVGRHIDKNGVVCSFLRGIKV